MVPTNKAMRNHFPSRRPSLLFLFLATFISGNPKVAFVSMSSRMKHWLSERGFVCVFVIPSCARSYAGHFIPFRIKTKFCTDSLTLMSA